jgi:hypothetical protein
MSYQRIAAGRAPPQQSSSSSSLQGDVRLIESSIAQHGVTPGGHAMMHAEAAAARASIASGMYISFLPHPNCRLTGDAHEGLRNGTSQCCRVGPESSCIHCGHTLSAHAAVPLPKRAGYIRPPTCGVRCRCPGFSYSPARPEECGQWWLPRRADLDLDVWRQRVRSLPHEYCCIGCEQKISDHETIFETRAMRIERGAAVDEAYVPLHEHRLLTEQVLEGAAPIGGRKRPAPRLLAKDASASASASASSSASASAFRGFK